MTKNFPFTHLDASGDVRQVPIQEKKVVRRSARATGFIRLSEQALKSIEQNANAKGNVLSIARIAGIQAAKRTAELIPLCHSLLLEHVSVDLEMKPEGVEVQVSVAAEGKTGVEMEALTAVAVALLTIYDMCKAIDKRMQIERIELLEKTKVPIK